MATALKSKATKSANKIALDAAKLFAKVAGILTVAQAVDDYVSVRKLASEYGKRKTALEEGFKKAGIRSFESADYIVSYDTGTTRRLSKEKLEEKFGVAALEDCYEDSERTNWSIVKKGE